MYGTRPSKNVCRFCASSGGAEVGAAVVAGAAAADGGADDAGAGGADGTCATVQNGRQTLAANSIHMRRFNMALSPQESWFEIRRSSRIAKCCFGECADVRGRCDPLMP